MHANLELEVVVGDVLAGEHHGLAQHDDVALHGYLAKASGGEALGIRAEPPATAWATCTVR